ncbi:class I SAM-dependent methyltransferase [Spirillospora sp. CA-253888]
MERDTPAEARNRARMSHRVRYAARHPGRVVPYSRRLARDAWLRLRNPGHIAYYRAVMRANAARSPFGAVGTADPDHWLRIGRLQFDYLLDHGLKPSDRVLDIGCGNLRAGHLLVEYLDPGHYYGLDISPDILFAAQDTLTRHALQDRLPHLTPVRDLRLDFLPAGHFTVVHAHSVFSHSPVEVVAECLANVGRVLAPSGFFDFTYNRTTGDEHHVLREDFYYRTETLVALAARHGLAAVPMEDWAATGHRQAKLRLTLPR